MNAAATKAKPAKSKGRRKSGIGPKDLEACLYPLVQREAGKARPANCWEVYASPEDSAILTLDLIARFAFDAIEHFVASEPRFPTGFIDELVAIAIIDKGLKAGEVRARALALEPRALASRRAQAAVTRRGLAERARPSPEPRLFTAKSKTAPNANPTDSSKGDRSTMGFKKFFTALSGKTPAAHNTASSRWASPDDIIQSTLAEIDDKAMNWPDGKDLPDRVIIYLSQADYARYGPRKRASEQHIEHKILDYAQECGALLERNPSVTLKVDPLLYCGQMRIDASFTDPASLTAPGTQNGPAKPTFPAISPAHANAIPGPSRGPATWQGSQHDAGRAVRPNAMATPEFKPHESMRTPEFKPHATSDCSIAKLTGSSFQSAVLAGDTIGRMRYSDRPKPTISLDGPDFEFVSQEQGTFEHDRDGWWFTSVGRNGTSVQRKGSWTKLTDGVRFALEDGDSISFGKCTPLTFSIAQ